MSSQSRGPTAGSNAGRGFRYQDLVGALFGVRIYLGHRTFSALVPEGSDDYEIQGDDGLILVDTKSNRPEARHRTIGDNLQSIETLWARPLRSDAQVAQFWLVTERTRNDAGAEKQSFKTSYTGTPPAKALRSFLVTEPNPLRAAVDLLVKERSITPLAAELVAFAFAQEIGNLASENGALPLEQRKAFTSSHAECVAMRVLTAVDVDRLDALSRSGFVRPVDFLTPVDDPGFYLGVDVQPGHFAAGLALERPDRAERVAEALDRTGAAIVRGPSGSGKSGLMWNAVIIRRMNRRWFRVNPTVSVDPEALTAFFDAFAVTDIGFVIDDIGRGGVSAWHTLRPRCEAHARAVIIGSIRSEDAALLDARHKISEIEAGLDEELARALWSKLRERGQSGWTGWREPWDQSQGLLLEYGHILTAGKRLEALILDQVRTRLDEQRDHELAILNASALAAAHGGTVSVATLRVHLKLEAADMARALSRLVAEHLVRMDASRSVLTGLHSLRAGAISLALSTLNYSTTLEQAQHAIAVAEPDSLEAVVSGLIASSDIADDQAAEAVATRVEAPTFRVFAAALRGLRAGTLTISTRTWLQDIAAAGIPRKLATTAAVIGSIDPTAFPDIGQIRELATHGNELHTTASAQHLPSAIVIQLLAALRNDGNNAQACDLVDALSAFARVSLTAEQLSELSSLHLPLSKLPLEDVISILDAGETISPSISLAWTSQAGHAGLLQRLSRETPFTLPLTIEETSEGIVVHGDIFEAALAPGDSPNDRLVTHVNAIMRLEQQAAYAHVRLVDMNGEKTLHLDAEKRIPRVNAPPKALSQSNSKVIDVVAREVSDESWSQYLSSGEALLRRGLRAFRKLLDSAMVGRVDNEALNELNDVVTACDNLVAPSDPPSSGAHDAALSGRHLTPLQDLIFNTNAFLISRIIQLPVQAAALASQVAGMVKRAEDAKREPWTLVRDVHPTALDELQKTLREIEVIALEAAASGANPRTRWSKINGKPKGAFDIVASGSRVAFSRRIKARCSEIYQLVSVEFPNSNVIAPGLSDGILWQTRFVATFSVGSFEEFQAWIDNAHTAGERLRARMDDNEDLVLIPLLNSQAAIDYAYQLSRGKPNSMVAPILVAAGQTNLLGAPDQRAIIRVQGTVLRHPVELERFFQAARDFAGMSQMRLGGSDRPVAEQEHLTQALTALADDGPRVLQLFESIDHPAIDAVRTILQVTLSGDVGDEATGSTLSPDDLRNLLAALTWKRAIAA